MREEAKEANEDSAPSASTPTMARPQRWDVPFGEDMSDADVERVLQFAPFKDFDPNRFPQNSSLHDILLNDTRIRKFNTNDIIVREGDYGSSAFIILSGSVKIFMTSLPQDMLGRRESNKSIFRSIAQLWNRPKEKEVLHAKSKAMRMNLASRKIGDDYRIFIQDAPRVLEKHRHIDIGEGEIIGELGALGRTPRTTTIIAGEDCELLELRWQGLREIRRYAPEWKKHLDKVYRENSLNSQLRETPLLQHLNPEDLAKVAELTQFETHGTFDWHASYQKMAQASSQERLSHEPIIAKEDHHIDGIILVRNGFARLSKHYNHGERTISYLSKGQHYGLAEIAWNYYATKRTKNKEAKLLSYQHSLRAVGYIDTLFIPTHIIEDYVLQTMSNTELEALFKDLDHGFADQPTPESSDADVPADTLEFLVEHRIINGSSAMLIDLERCTRCDDCVRACASAHDNNPRFIREGKEINNTMITQACMHCVDPVCMIGCPTGAIHRDADEGQIVINDDTCIGCATCANSCPYGNIKMIDIRDLNGQFIRDEHQLRPIQKATKCDLCVDQLGGPACQRACPHDAMFRADMRNTKELARWLNR
ncbi:MAG: cyclic nucleotide-binding domain-containing protein [Opitutaceae bacterium]